MSGLSLSRRSIAVFAVLGFTAALAGAVLLVTEAPEPGPPSVIVAPPGLFVSLPQPQPVPALRFRKGDGQPAALADFAGRVVLLNLWASWCAPCVREMPALDRLQAALGGPDFAVVALSEDRGGAAVVLPFLQQQKLSALDPYLDPEGLAEKAFGTQGLPTSILIDRDGREIGRVLGVSPWDTPENRQLILEKIAAGRR
jgi:thiol-disulfide isomerase/thioredoxin